jgi:8-oxo-dGTP diphosphatase
VRHPFIAIALITYPQIRGKGSLFFEVRFPVSSGARIELYWYHALWMLSSGYLFVQFQNTPNQCIHFDGKDYWMSRSVTVLGILFFVVGRPSTENLADNTYVPLGLRGVALPDEVGKWGLPGGYLDYDETVGGALLREVWEELGINLRELCVQYRFIGSLEQPYYVFSEPIRRQNVTLRFPALFFVEAFAQLPALLTKVTEDEVAETRWFSLREALGMELAFGHQTIIQHCLEHYYQDSDLWSL